MIALRRPAGPNPNDPRLYVSPACRLGDHSNCTGAAAWRCNCHDEGCPHRDAR